MFGYEKVADMTHHEAAKILDATSVTVAAGTVFGWLPSIAAAFTIIWTGLRIYEWFEARIDRRKNKE